jgi:histidinol-phosphate aminotransferase
VLTSASGGFSAAASTSADAGILRLDANESTIPPSPAVTSRVRAFLDEGRASWYPDSDARALRRRLAASTSRSEQDVLVFNGCDAAIDCAVRTFTAPGDRVCIAAPTYDRFRRSAEAAGVHVHAAYGANPFAADLQSLLDAIGGAPRLVYLSNPDNPTGRTFSVDEIALVLSHLTSGLLIVDETYFEFAGLTAVPLIDRFETLIVMRSFSKAFGLAGLRCGYTLSAPATADRLRRFWSGRDVNGVAQTAALAALDDLDYMRGYVDEVTAARAWLVDGLRTLGHVVVSTPANFVLLRMADAPAFVEDMRREGILIRDRSHLPQLDGFVRITVGTLPQCERVLDTIRRLSPLPAR